VFYSWAWFISGRHGSTPAMGKVNFEQPLNDVNCDIGKRIVIGWDRLLETESILGGVIRTYAHTPHFRNLKVRSHYKL